MSTQWRYGRPSPPIQSNPTFGDVDGGPHPPLTTKKETGPASTHTHETLSATPHSLQTPKHTPGGWRRRIGPGGGDAVGAEVADVVAVAEACSRLLQPLQRHQRCGRGAEGPHPKHFHGLTGRRGGWERSWGRGANFQGRVVPNFLKIVGCAKLGVGDKV